MNQWLKKLRAERGFTQESFARELDIAKTTYASYEQGYRTPSIANAKKIAQLLELHWTIFFDTEVLDMYLKNKKMNK